MKNSGTSSAIEADLQKLKVFISHQYADSDFAVVIEDKLREWGFKRENIFITSHGSIALGDDIDLSIKENLGNCDLLIHIFTHSSQNWEWAAREIGIVETLPTPPRIITFQIFDDEPNIRQSNLWIPLEETAIRNFVHSLFTKDGFFPGYLPVSPIPEEEGFKRERHSKYIENQSQDLYKLLKHAADNFDTEDLKLVTKEDAPEPKPSEEELRIFITAQSKDDPESFGASSWGVRKEVKRGDIILFYVAGKGIPHAARARLNPVLKDNSEFWEAEIFVKSFKALKTPLPIKLLREIPDLKNWNVVSSRYPFTNLDKYQPGPLKGEVKNALLGLINKNNPEFFLSLPHLPDLPYIGRDAVPTHSDIPAEIDELGRKPFAEVLALRIDEVWKKESKKVAKGAEKKNGQDGGEQAFMVHIHGAWGIGKTSVLNFLREETYVWKVRRSMGRG